MGRRFLCDDRGKKASLVARLAFDGRPPHLCGLLKQRDKHLARSLVPNGRRLRWSLAIIAVTVEISAFVAWRVMLRRRGR